MFTFTKIKSIENAASPTPTAELPRIYVLHRSVSQTQDRLSLKFASLTGMIRNFFQMRVDRIRNLELTKRNQQRLKDPTLFPPAPKGDLQ